MGWNDHIDYGRSEIELPEEAASKFDNPFNPRDEWIKTASREHQIEAMRRWFLARYTDPAHETPYCSAEGGYIFIHGGPYDPNEEIQGRFSGLVEYDVMEELIDELLGEHGDQWAALDWDMPDYDDALSMNILDRGDPSRMLSDRLSDVQAVLDFEGPERVKMHVIQLAFSAAITALEAYLWDTATYWSENSNDVFKRLIETNIEFGREKIQISEIFNAANKLRDKVNSYLRDFVWHRLDKVKPIFEDAFEIEVPDVGPLMEKVLIRHHIAHRGGRDKEGRIVSVTPDDVFDTIILIRDFSAVIEREISRKYQPEKYGVLNF